MTHVYIVYVKPEAEWDSEEFLENCPVQVDRFLCDLMHCPGKTGVDVFGIVQRQFNAKGLYLHECMSGVGDGGGENEGSAGIHSIIETENASYVRRRCFGHFPWRVADQGLLAMGETMTSTNSLCVYLREGITWTRLKAVATQPLEHGGLNIMAEGDAEYVRFFSRAPPNILEDRPETASEFLKWLVAHDVDQRSLRSPSSRTAVETLGQRDDFLKRRLCQVVIEKGLFMYYYCKEHTHIAFKTTFADLIGRASTIVTSLAADDDFFRSFYLTRDEVLARGITQHQLDTMNWVELVMRTADGMTDAEFTNTVDAMLRFQSLVAFKMASHMQLTANNMERAPWIAARILCNDPIRAVEGANEFFEHIIRRTDARMTAFERSFMADDELRIQLEDFKDQQGEPHTWKCVWQRGGRYAKLFKFLIARFGGAPDSVLQCEGATVPIDILKLCVYFVSQLNQLTEQFFVARAAASSSALEVLRGHVVRRHFRIMKLSSGPERPDANEFRFGTTRTSITRDGLRSFRTRPIDR